MAGLTYMTHGFMIWWFVEVLIDSAS